MGRKLPSVRRVLLFVAVAGLPFFAVLVFSAGRGHSAGPGLAPLFACPTAPGGAARCNARVLASQEAKPMVSAAPVSGYGPDQLRTAYGLVAAAGQQTTAVVAIVDAYDDPTAKSDLDTYNTTFGLPAFPTCSGSSNAGCFRKVNQTGGTSYPSTDGGWALEISLDVQTVHALCPNCGILLVEANSSNVTDLYAAEDYAAGHATVVSNSWGLSEYNGETSADGHFNHPGVAITFSTGDGGYGVQYPAASRYVTAVGGTTLNLNADNTRSSETAWDGAGSGCSAYETKPSWQTDSGCTRRTVADVSADADPNTGAAVYDSTPYCTGTPPSCSTGWYIVGGTSLASPIVASVYALAGVGGSSSMASIPYAHTSSLYDVTSGSNGSCSPSYLCNATTGYDGPTGLGTPVDRGAFSSAGLLRVTTSPALASQLSIDGVIANSWGLDWLKLAPGTHTLASTHVEGYSEPASQQVTVTTGQTTTVSASFTQRGSLRVITSPAVPAAISVDGVPRNDWGMWTDIATGNHQVCFGPAPDFDPPSCQNVSVNAGQLTTVTGTYTSDPGAAGASGKGLLRVTTSPALASQILIDGVVRNSWGLDWLELDPGTYTVSFTHVEGYTEPAPQQVTVTAGQTTTLAGSFTQRGSLRVITSPAVPATITVDGVPRNDWGLWTDMPTGNHQVCFGWAVGYTAPVCQTVNLTTAGATIQGTYVPGS